VTIAVPLEKNRLKCLGVVITGLKYAGGSSSARVNIGSSRLNGNEEGQREGNKENCRWLHLNSLAESLEDLRFVK
jgi:hypothetical protein